MIPVYIPRGGPRMVKLICFLKRKAGLSRAEFRDHWLNRHGPLVASSPDFARHIVRYEQNHRLDEDYAREEGGGFDGVTVQWFEAARNFLAFAREPSYRDTIFVDESKFLDHEGLVFVLTQEPENIIQHPGGRSGARVKLICMLARNPSLDREQFHTHWREVHGPLFRDTPELARHILAYDQHRRLDKDYERDAAAGFDGVAEQFYASLAEFEALCAEPAYAERVYPDEDYLLERERILYIMSGPAHVIIG